MLYITDIKEIFGATPEMFISKETIESKMLNVSLDELNSALINAIKVRIKNRVPIFLDISGIEKETLLAIQSIANHYKLPIEKLPSDFKLNLNEIDSSIKLDVVGDVHGLYNETIKLMIELGYDIDGNHPDKARKLLFLGDIIDRGPDSIKMLRLVKKLTESGHFCIMGNHEEELLRLYTASMSQKDISGGHSTMDTLSKLLKEDDKVSLIKFIGGLKSFYTWNNYVMVHGDISKFDGFNSPLIELLNGTHKKRKEITISDKEYHENFINGVNKYKLIRGHMVGDNNLSSVQSLDEDSSFNGNIVCLSLFLINDNDYEAAKTRISVSFNHKGTERKIRKFRTLEKQGLLIRSELSTFLAMYTGTRNCIADFAGNEILSFSKEGTFYGKDPYSGCDFMIKDSKFTLV